MGIKDTAEYQRLDEDQRREKHWRKWGPYVSERQWGTIREDYSADGDAWNYFTHHQSRYRTYRWGEDGIAGISDNHQSLCFAIALWNGRDRILKERLFGLTGHEGNHGEDVKEEYFYLDNTPSHAYMKYLYRYPQSPFPYDEVREENAQRTKQEPEFELIDTGIFEEKEYFDITVEYAKADEKDICIKITAKNLADHDASLVLLGQIWFRNTWRWDENKEKPIIKLEENKLKLDHHKLGVYYLHTDTQEIIFTDNETNSQVLYNDPNRTQYTKEGFHRYIINGLEEAINPEQFGTKAAAVYRLNIAAKKEISVIMRLSDTALKQPFEDVEEIYDQRKKEADQFYSYFLSTDVDLARIQRQAFAGMLWNKQFYHYIVRDWLQGDPAEITPPTDRLQARNADWKHFYAEDILSMPDKWEYPWFASWDTAFHLIPLVMIDPNFAKKQLVLFTREWYIHPNGNIPAYEWDFNDTNPPVLVYAAWKIFKLETEIYGTRDIAFLERVFHKFLLNFTWWVNKRDMEGNNIFSGGFLGLDNIGVFDRSHPIPGGEKLDQADATSWMAMYSLVMMRIALELAQENQSYEDIASKFFEHYIRIAHSIKTLGKKEHRTGLWDNEDMFFYDMLHWKSGDSQHLKIRSIVGIIPLFAVEVIEEEILEKVPDFERRMHWFIENRKDLSGNVTCENLEKEHHRHIFSIVQQQQLQPILKRVFDSEEFLSEYGIRSLSKWHQSYPYEFSGDKIEYEPAESISGMFGGNSNWRGPIWFPINYLLIEALYEYSTYFGEEFLIEFPTNSGNHYEMDKIANMLRERLIGIFKKEEGKRAVFFEKRERMEDWRDNLLFFEYFNGDTGEGLGASHQTGWTGLIAELIYRMDKKFQSDPV